MTPAVLVTCALAVASESLVGMDRIRSLLPVIMNVDDEQRWFVGLENFLIKALHIVDDR